MEIYKDERHLFYWVENSTLYETYHTIRGPRHRALLRVDFSDYDNLSDEKLNTILESPSTISLYA